MRERIPRIIKWIYPRRIWDGPAAGKSIYLTFDDGPIEDVTPWVLEQLKAYNAKATFFCIGENVQKNPGIFREVINAGHSVGNHTYNHLDGWRTGIADYLQNTEQARQVMRENFPAGFGPKNDIFRPPYGKIRNVQAKKLQERDFTIVMWSIVSMDYNQRLSWQSCYQNVLKNARPGSIIVFHDSLKAENNLRQVLPRVLKHFSSEGYTFRALE